MSTSGTEVTNFRGQLVPIIIRRNKASKRKKKQSKRKKKQRKRSKTQPEDVNLKKFTQGQNRHYIRIKKKN